MNVRIASATTIRSGVDQTVAMKISGHESPEVFRRYNITSETDKRQAMTAVETFLAGEHPTTVVPLKLAK